MAEEKLEFSAQDLGRLAYYVGDLDSVLEWLDSYATDPAEAQRVRDAAIAGYDEESAR